jgi:hypothetical protein
MTNEKGIAVAQDVLKHLDIMKVSEGAYLKLELASGNESKLTDTGDLQDQIGVAVQECQVCALGACLLSKARLYDAVPSRVVFRFFQISDDEGIRSLLRDVFDIDTINLIETAFERHIFSWCRHGSCENDLLHAERFGDRHKCPYARMRAIMNNIVVNSGYFVP